MFASIVRNVVGFTAGTLDGLSGATGVQFFWTLCERLTDGLSYDLDAYDYAVTRF